MKRNKVLMITMYIISIIIYIILSLTFYNLLIMSNIYYLFVIIPLLFLFSILALSNIIKLILTLISMIFGRNDNDEVKIYIYNAIQVVNRLTIYSLLGVFITLLSSITILDIVYCMDNQKYTLVAISLVIWILLYYVLFSVIIKGIKKKNSI